MSEFNHAAALKVVNEISLYEKRFYPKARVLAGAYMDLRKLAEAATTGIGVDRIKAVQELRETLEQK